MAGTVHVSELDVAFHLHQFQVTTVLRNIGGKNNAEKGFHVYYEDSRPYEALLGHFPRHFDTAFCEELRD